MGRRHLHGRLGAAEGQKPPVLWYKASHKGLKDLLVAMLAFSYATVPDPAPADPEEGAQGLLAVLPSWLSRKLAEGGSCTF